MSDVPNIAAESTPEKEFLDFNTVQVLRERVSPVDRSYSKADLDSGMIGRPGPARDLPAPAAVEAPPAAAPLPTPPAAAVVVPVAPAAPTSDTYPARVNDRINKLWGQKQAAVEQVPALQDQLADQARGLDALTARETARPQAPYTNQYGSSGLDPSQGNPPPADLVSQLRAEMQVALQEQGRGIAEFLALQTQHTAARAEAERDFPDVFGRPEVRAAYDQIWSSDPYLQRDPNGPVKAAALARGFMNPDPRSTPAQPSADVQKQVLAGIGASVPQGSVPANAQEQRYREAMAIAASTQRPADFVRARMIMAGLA